MNIYLVRHGPAVDEGPRVPDDLRHLTSDGRAICRAAAAAFGGLGVKVDLVVSSPLVRAMQTAEIIVAGMGWTGEVVALDALAGAGGVRLVMEWLDEHSAEDVMVVGHEPGISMLAGALAGVRNAPGFAKAEIRCVADGRAAWAMSPPDFDRGPWV